MKKSVAIPFGGLFLVSASVILYGERPTLWIVRILFGACGIAAVAFISRSAIDWAKWARRLSIERFKNAVAREQLHRSVIFGDGVNLEVLDGPKPSLDMDRSDTQRQSVQFDDKIFQETPNHLERLGDVGKAIQAVLKEHRVDAKLRHKIQAPQLTRYVLAPGQGVKVDAIRGLSEEFQVGLGLPFAPYIGAEAEGVVIDVLKDKPETVFWKNQDVVGDSPVSFPIGITVTGDPLWIDLSSSLQPHMLIAGASGCGKSSLLQSIVASLAANDADAGELRFTLVDPKYMTFSPDHTASPFLSRPVITDVDETIAMLSEAVKDVDFRCKELSRLGYSDLMEAYSDGHQPFPFHVIVVDEFGDIMMSGDKRQAQSFEGFIVRIGQKGRAAGVHLILATQRPDRKIVTGKIRANIPVIVCMKTATWRDSQVVIESNGGESLAGKGDMLVQTGKGISRCQSFYITATEFLVVLQSHEFFDTHDSGENDPKTPGQSGQSGQPNPTGTIGTRRDIVPLLPEKTIDCARDNAGTFLPDGVYTSRRQRDIVKAYRDIRDKGKTSLSAICRAAGLPENGTYKGKVKRELHEYGIEI